MDKLTRKQTLAFSRSLRRRGLKPLAVGSCAIIRAGAAKAAEVCHYYEGGKHVYYRMGKLDRESKQRVRASKPARGQPEFILHTGQPSWHQRRAGHISAGSTVFHSRGDADGALRRYQATHPGDPAFVVEQKRR